MLEKRSHKEYIVTKERGIENGEQSYGLQRPDWT
jgi:hypothetical protein